MYANYSKNTPVFHQDQIIINFINPENLYQILPTVVIFNVVSNIGARRFEV